MQKSLPVKGRCGMKRNTWNADFLYMITNGEGQVIDPNEFVFEGKPAAIAYMAKNWAKTEIEVMNITVESIAEILGLE